MSKIDNLGVDYIVEQGTSGIWTYRKWNSGISECWGIGTYTVNVGSKWGDNDLYFESGKYATEKYPDSLFTQRPICNFSCESSPYGLLIVPSGQDYSNNTRTPSLQFIRPSIESEITVRVYWYAIGK